MYDEVTNQFLARGMEKPSPAETGEKRETLRRNGCLAIQGASEALQRLSNEVAVSNRIATLAPAISDCYPEDKGKVEA